MSMDPEEKARLHTDIQERLDSYIASERSVMDEILVTNVTVSYGRTIPTKPYGGDRVDVSMSADVGPTRDAETVTQELLATCRAIVDRAESNVSRD